MESTSVTVTESDAGALANFDDFDAFQEAADALQGEGRPILKLDKSGRWFLGQDDEEVADGTQFAANIVESELGWMFWRNGKPEERRMGRVAARFQPAMRADLGHTDEGLWETDDEGRPQDPWRKSFEIPVREIGGDQREITIAGSSRGFEGAFKKLLGQFGKEGRLNEGKMPIVQIDSDSYNHSNPRYGRIYVPIMRIVAWIEPSELADDAGEDPEAKPEQEASEAKPARKNKARF